MCLVSVMIYTDNFDVYLTRRSHFSYLSKAGQIVDSLCG